jgi:uncharacterized protein YdcH (DUF465 family)
MDRCEEVIVRALAQESEEFRRALEAHKHYEAILEELVRRSHLAADDEMEKKKIQKLKLAGKDRMAKMISAYRKGHPELFGESGREGEGTS